ncbi:hypothetical protein A2U01_0097068, partial [Trifolium medium]|nr:hypothetical protein [Trifolium medium]
YLHHCDPPYMKHITTITISNLTIGVIEFCLRISSTNSD